MGFNSGFKGLMFCTAHRIFGWWNREEWGRRGM